ncbi:Os05g0390550 [Oryza sativa Japonica Group]|uniref:Os05g0390550 protein n=1 Tax=Oryza sativa subsp. japonica TaxID=39947 RepID=A0A0P0WLS7_ORYSJ|nr:Os05g0390550 [Oryza sativa Japonica Group]
MVTAPPIVLLQCAMAPSMALWSSSIDDAVDSDTGPTLMPPDIAAAAAAGTSGKPTPPAPPKVSRPEWLGEERIEDGQLAAHRFWRGNRRFPEKELECAYLPPPPTSAATAAAAAGAAAAWSSSPRFLRIEKLNGFFNPCCCCCCSGWPLLLL